MRGFKRTSSLDNLYFFQTFIQYPNTTKIYFIGYTVSDMVWDFVDQMMRVYVRGQLAASIETKIPLGTMEGKIVSNDKNTTTSHSVKLSRVCMLFWYDQHFFLILSSFMK